MSTTFLIVILYKAVRTFESMNETVKCDHSSESQAFTSTLVCTVRFSLFWDFTE